MTYAGMSLRMAEIMYDLDQGKYCDDETEEPEEPANEESEEDDEH